MSTHRVFEHRVRALVALLALLVLTVGLAACGGSGGSSDGGSGGGTDAAHLLDATFSGSHSIKSGNLRLELGIDAQGDPTLQGPVRIDLSGPFQSAKSKGQIASFNMTAALSAQGQTFQAGLISTGSSLFVKFGGTNYVAPDDLTRQLIQSYEQQSGGGSSSGSSQGLGAFGIHPLNWLSTPKVVGDENVGGTQATHISATLNTARFLDDVDTFLARANAQGLGAATGQRLPQSLSAADRRQVEDAVRTARVDVWTGKDDHTLRKATVVLSLDDREQGRTETATVTFSVELTDLNKPQTITAPSNPQQLDELLGQISSLLGGSVPGASSGGGSSSGGGAGAAAGVDRYTRCIQDANGDLKKVQACANLLGG